MRTLNVTEIVQVSGGNNQSLYDAFMVSGTFASIFSMAGSILGVYWYLHSGNTAYTLTTYAAWIQGHALLTFPIAIFAGIGLGGCIGALTGLGLYYSGLTSKPEN